MALEVAWRRPALEGAAPAARYAHTLTLCAAAGKCVLLGGSAAGGGEPLAGGAPHALDLATGRWEALDGVTVERGGALASPGERSGHSACGTCRGDVVVFGGRLAGGVLTADVSVFDVVARVWRRVDVTGTPPSPRERHAAAMLTHDAMAVFGGTNGVRDLSDVHVLNLRTWAWSVQGVSPVPRANLSAALLGEFRVLLVGGARGAGLAAPVVWDAVSAESALSTGACGGGQSIAALRGHRAVEAGEHIWIVGGMLGTTNVDGEELGRVDATSGASLASGVLALDRETGESQPAVLAARPRASDGSDSGSTEPVARSFAAVCAVAPGLVLVHGGADTTGEPLADLWVLQLPPPAERDEGAAWTRRTSAGGPLIEDEREISVQIRLRPSDVERHAAGLRLAIGAMVRRLLAQDTTMGKARAAAANRTERLADNATVLSADVDDLSKDMDRLESEMALRRREVSRLRNAAISL